ncbi:hypothetical protein COT72_01045 [archaeon CG10_big_fil_rev_8_21_14_0_10_43_11]|nr:MAG: hypothetical protein COT72_01045 [archaeon CG10_big_fil_rev_8_21_14_0_10_43_11]
MKPVTLVSRVIHEYAFYGMFVVCLLLVLFAVLLGMSFVAALVFVLGLPISMYANKYLKNAFKTSRPRNTPQTMDYSFPSNHTQTVTYVLVFLGVHAPFTLVFTLPLFIALVFHRLQGKHHHLQDIIGGVLFGSIIAFFLTFLAP